MTTPPRRVLVTHRRSGAGRPPPRPGRRAGLDTEPEVAELFIASLVRALLALAARLVAVFACLLGGIPLLFAVSPAARSVRVLGLGLPWLLLGIAVYPCLVAGGYLYVRLAERNEQEFLDALERS